ncbi:hypothetical protein O6H91_16G090900 [Diphasiastrum complanatum]|uniref:Uncharacterized protein n=1 Tax=Diphasiastrum complanatum TaxID=34168 RepID=A0ACC2BFR0_DIPCM|nr:hypothetical protein O6H91_16G090900 [Diphasiastrum complanatum]
MGHSERRGTSRIENISKHLRLSEGDWLHCGSECVAQQPFPPKNESCQVVCQPCNPVSSSGKGDSLRADLHRNSKRHKSVHSRAKRSKSSSATGKRPIQLVVTLAAQKFLDSDEKPPNDT